MPIGTAPPPLRLPSMSEILTVSRSRGRNSEAPNLWKGLVGAWPMQEGRGDKVYDAGGRGNTGTLTNMDPATDWITGPIGRGLEFDSTVDDYVDLGNPYYGPDMSGLTVSLWLRPSGSNNRIIITDGATWDTGTFFVNVKGLDDKYEFLIYGANYDNVDSATIVSTTQWSHFCGIWAAGERVEIYHNGVLDSDVGSRGGSAQNSLQVAGTTLQLGRRPGDTSIDPSCVTASLAIYDRALTPSEVQELYERPWSMYRSRPVQVMGGVAAVEAPVIDDPGAQTGTVGIAFTLQMTASNTPTSWSAVSLPDGLSIDNTGLVSGTPTQAESPTAAITATNAGGDSSPQNVLFTISDNITATNTYGSDGISFTWTVNPAVRSSVGTGAISAPQSVGSDWAAVNQWDVVEAAEGVEVFEEKGFRILEAGGYEVTALIRRDNPAGEIELAWATIDEDTGSLTIHETWPDTQVLQQDTAELEPGTLVGVVVRTDATVPVMLNLLPGSSLSIKRVL